MRKALVHTLALCALGLTAPVVAETLYVPVAEPLGVDGAPLATELQISNYDLTDRPYTATFLASEGRATAKSGRVTRDVVPADQAVVLDKIAPAGQPGLLAIEAEPGMLVDAFVKTASRGVTYITGVPVISRFHQVAANDTALLNGLGRDVTSLALVNLGNGAAACHVDFVRADGSLAGSPSSITVEAKSLRQFEDALGLGSEPEAVAAQVSCDQSFFAYATALDRETSEVSFTIPAPAGEAVAAPARRSRGKEDLPAGTVVFTKNGFFHNASRGNEKAEIRVPTGGKELKLAKMITEWNVKVGPWSPRFPGGTHNLIWMHRGKYRSNTIANSNAWGNGKDRIGNNQNVDMAKGTNTKMTIGVKLVKGETYRIVHTYDAANREVFVNYIQGNTVLRIARYAGTAQNRTLTIPATGSIAEFGHWANQHKPEMATWGWSYGNLRVTQIPKGAPASARK
ncbi:MAG TPA: hypothetical protein VLQ45_00950 [Thermoanaerobaculia bacterium]|nr:hypothetical protein [Thermoanaerobaculia bacterium]